MEDNRSRRMVNRIERHTRHFVADMNAAGPLNFRTFMYVKLLWPSKRAIHDWETPAPFTPCFDVELSDVIQRASMAYIIQESPDRSIPQILRIRAKGVLPDSFQRPVYDVLPFEDALVSFAKPRPLPTRVTSKLDNPQFWAERPQVKRWP